MEYPEKIISLTSMQCRVTTLSCLGITCCLTRLSFRQQAVFARVASFVDSNFGILKRQELASVDRLISMGKDKVK